MHKLSVKFFVETDTFTPTEFVPVFHRWIQTHALPGHMLIDVADYAHVPGGPGTLLVASEANIHMDRSHSRLGLLYVRKRPVENAHTFEPILEYVLHQAATAAALMGQEPVLKGRLRFRTDEIAVRFNDRLTVPNSPDSITELQPHVLSVARRLFGPATTVNPHNTTSLELLEFRIKSPGSPPVSVLQDQLAALIALE